MSCGNNGIRWGFNALFLVFGAFIIIASLYMAKDIEQTYFPVVEEFNILNIEDHGEGFKITGTLQKARECEYLGMIAYVDKQNSDAMQPLLVEFYNDVVSTRAPIKQTWGPWYVNIPYDYDNVNIDFYVHHRCHSFYMTSAQIASFNVTKKDHNQYSIEQ